MAELTALEYALYECWMYGIIAFSVLGIACGMTFGIVLFVRLMVNILTKRGANDG